jgi:serine/threonine-protein phosphatase 4 regulatory subunit 4
VLFFSCFKHLATKSDVELRRLCAGQLPAVLRAATALSATAFAQQFQDTLISLATDPDVEVRRTVAGQLHEVARVVGKDCPPLLTRPLCRLLRDEAPAVPAALLPTLTLCLGHWLIRDESRRDSAMGDLAKALLELETSTKRNWRMQQQLASAFPIFPQARGGAGLRARRGGQRTAGS